MVDIYLHTYYSRVIAETSYFNLRFIDFFIIILIEGLDWFSHMLSLNDDDDDD